MLSSFFTDHVQVCVDADTHQIVTALLKRHAAAHSAQHRLLLLQQSAGRTACTQQTAGVGVHWATDTIIPTRHRLQHVYTRRTTGVGVLSAAGAIGSEVTGQSIVSAGTFAEVTCIGMMGTIATAPHQACNALMSIKRSL